MIPISVIAAEENIPMTWREQSYMGRKSVAGGAAGRMHLLNKNIQGEYHYVCELYAKPVMTITPGDIVITMVPCGRR